jgi:hypothetical protein
MARQVEYLDELGAAIQLKYQCVPTHKGSVLVDERTAAGETIWEGEVEVFELSDPDGIKTCYVWMNRNGDKTRIMTVLGSNVVDSPQRAVQAAIFVDAQPPVVSRFRDEFVRLNWQLAEAKRILRETCLKMEDLDIAIQEARAREGRKGKGNPLH